MPSYSRNISRKGHPQNIDPEGEFCLPVLLPDDPEWVAMFLGALERLGNRSTWDYDEGGDYVVVSDRWKQIARETANAYQAALSCAVDAPDEGDGCLEIGAFHPAISYYPNHPILSPDEDGPYVSPIWGNGAGYIGATGADAMIDPLGFLGQTVADIINGGIVPSAELSFSGSGEIDVHLIQTIQGGAVWIFPDGNPLLGDLVSLSFTDLTELLGVETLIDAYELIFQADLEAFVRVHTVNFETEGDHTLTMWFFPTVDPEPPFVGSGGGLRSIQLCGNATVLEDIVVPYTMDAQPDGSIRLLADGVPVSTVDLKDLLDDDYVNVEGDTMTGLLTRQIPGSPTGGEDQALSFRRGGTQTMLMRILADNIFFQSFSNWGWEWRGYRDGFIIRQMNGASTSIMRWLDESAVIRAMATLTGRFRGTGFDSFDYSSTSTWRKQFGLQGAWKSSVDATYKGRVELDVSGYDGDHEVFAAEYGDSILDLPAIGFFGHLPNTRQPLAPSGIDGAVLAMHDQLAAYGLLDLDIKYGTIPTADPAGIVEPRKCSAAYFFADSLADMITAIFDNLTTVSTQEVLTGLIEDYQIPASAAHQVLLAFQADFADSSGILDDLTDTEAIAETLLDCDFDRACFYDWIDVTSGWIVQTAEIVKAVLDVSWDTLGAFWFALGQFVDHPACNQFAWSCQDHDFSFLFGPPPGVEIQQGVAGGLAAGLTVAPSGPNWGSWVEWRLQGCTVQNVHVEYEVVYIPQTMHITWFSGSEGDWTQQGTIAVGHSATGPDDYDSGALFGSAGNTTRILVRMENEPTASAANVIYHVNFSMGS